MDGGREGGRREGGREGGMNEWREGGGRDGGWEGGREGERREGGREEGGRSTDLPFPDESTTSGPFSLKSPNREEPPGPPCNHSNSGASLSPL